jgi:hypothetical protein
LNDAVLLRICRVSKSDAQVTPAWMSDLRLAARLVGEPRLRQDVRLEAAVTLLASSLGKLTQFNPTHLPFGYHGPEVRSRDWIEREALERVGKQIVGLMWRNAAAEVVVGAVQRAVSESVRLGFLEERQYDAWRPGMRSGSGWRTMVSATPYGVAKASVASGDSPDIAVQCRDDHRCAPTGDRRAQRAPEATTARDAQGRATSSSPSDDRFQWARQIDLVRATNQVLGDGMLNKGVLSRACADGHVETNGKPGRGARVRVRSFLTWVSRQNQLGAEETNQIRNAVIGEISARNS